MNDVIIIGAGICGSFIAHELSRYQLDVCVLESENDVANGVTMANSAIIHAGYDPKEGSLKATLNVEGALMYEQVCADIGADYQKIGAYILAQSVEGEEQLQVLKAQADKRGIANALITPAQLRRIEPNLSSKVTFALSIPDTAIISPWEVAINLMEEAIINGVDLHLDTKVEGIEQVTSGEYKVSTNKGDFSCKYLINAAGCGVEKIAAMLEEPPFHLELKRGQYFVLSKFAKGFVNHVLYPVPTTLGKGVLALPTTHGNTLLGPTAERISHEDLATSSQGMDYIREHLQDIVEHVPYQEVIRSYSGIRPCGNHGDFYIKEASTKGFFHVACIDSPGLASAPAIAKYVIEELLGKYLSFVPKVEFKKRRKSILLEHKSQEEKNNVYTHEPRFAHMICRCEHISEGEVLDAIHRPCGARSIKGVKKRVRAGMGKCQGGFCEVEVAKILARELAIPLEAVVYDNEQTMLGKRVK